MKQDYPFGMREKQPPERSREAAEKEKKENETNKSNDANDDDEKEDCTKTASRLVPQRTVTACPELAAQNPHLVLAVITQRLQRLRALQPEEHTWLAANPQHEYGLWTALTAGQLRWYQQCGREFRESCRGGGGDGGARDGSRV